MSDSLADVLGVKALADNRYDAPHPADDPEGRNIVFSGQLMAQMILAADISVESRHDVKSIHSTFSRAGTYDHPMELTLDTTHSGRLFGSTTATAYQNDRLLCRSMLLMNNYEEDLVRHEPQGPSVPSPESLAVDEVSLGFPGTETRTILDDSEVAADGSPSMSFWVKSPQSYESVAVNQGVLAWAQPGNIIGLALRPHTDVISIEDAHVSISTGVIAHTTHFQERFDVSEWLLVQQEATYIGRGRVFGSGSVYNQAGHLVSTFSQDSMVRSADRPLDPNKSM